MALLEIEDATVYLSESLILKDINLEVEEGESVSILGPNGAGKTTFFRAISGLIPYEGSIRFQGEEISDYNPAERVKLGMAQCPQEGQLFAESNVERNLKLGAYLRENKEDVESDLETVFELFPILEERLNQQASSLSGGESKMLALGRTFMSDPKLMMLDEPSAGLAPIPLQKVRKIIQELRKEFNQTMLIIEQNADMAFDVTERLYVLREGEIKAQGMVDEIKDEVMEKHLSF